MPALRTVLTTPLILVLLTYAATLNISIFRPLPDNPGPDPDAGEAVPAMALAGPRSFPAESSGGARMVPAPPVGSLPDQAFEADADDGGVPGVDVPMATPSGLPPNEAGKVMILLYHGIGEEEGEWTRDYRSFRQDLSMLYAEGYRPVSLREYLDDAIDLPAGYSPVILTFDDSSQGQFKYLFDEDRPVLDTRSAVGIMKDFGREHPDFNLRGVFFVNFPYPFRQPAHWQQKLQELVSWGMEIGNHTYRHLHLGRATAAEIQADIVAALVRIREAVPGYDVQSFALPYGAWPADRSLVVAGEAGGVTYGHRAVLLVGANPAPSPVDRDFDPLRLPRIQARRSELDRWLSHFRRNPGERYVSDGDTDIITVPASLRDRVSPAALEGKELRVYPAQSLPSR